MKENCTANQTVTIRLKWSTSPWVRRRETEGKMELGVQRSRLHFTVSLLKVISMKSKSHRSQPAHTTKFTFFLHFQLPLLPSETCFCYSISSTFSNNPPFTPTSFQSRLKSLSTLSIFVWSALCLCTDSFKQISSVKSSVSTWNGTKISSQIGSRWW